MVQYLIPLIIALAASTIGAISGIGGGIIMKPVLDALGALDIPSINFLSGCTVLAMTTVSLLRARGQGGIAFPVSLYLALGAVVGGLLGKEIFSLAAARSPHLALIQSATLFAVNAIVLVYVLTKGRIRSLQVSAMLPSSGIGLALGFISAFLGIGGGPINIAMLRFFFSMSPKATVLNSLFVIFCSQIASLASVILQRRIPTVDPVTLVVMMVGGVLGAFIGRNLSKTMAERALERFFLVVLCGLLGLTAWNLLVAL